MEPKDFLRALGVTKSLKNKVVGYKLALLPSNKSFLGVVLEKDLNFMKKCQKNKKRKKHGTVMPKFAENAFEIQSLQNLVFCDKY